MTSFAIDIKGFLLLALLVPHQFKKSTARFHVRNSATSTLSMAEIRATNCHKHEQMYRCYMGCLQDPCCLAVKMAGECETSYIPTEAMDLVKEVNFCRSLELSLFVNRSVTYQLILCFRNNAIAYTCQTNSNSLRHISLFL